MNGTEGYVVGLTADGADESGFTIFGDIGLERLTDAGIAWKLLPPIPAHGPVDPKSLTGVDAVISLGHVPFDADLVRQTPRLRHVARFGAGYDGIDPVGLAGEGVVVTTAPRAVRTSLALSALTLLLACAYRLVENHEVTVSGRWATDRGRRRGIGADGRTVGIVGFGSVGSLLAQHLRALGLSVVAVDRPSAGERAAALGVELVELSVLAARSDFVVVTATLNASTEGMLDDAFFRAMKPSAYLINVARGAIVDQAALTRALAEGRIAGAGLDVYDPEPPASDDPLLSMPQVIATPHALCWTEDFTRDVSASLMDAVLTAARGEVPDTALERHLVNPATWRGATAM